MAIGEHVRAAWKGATSNRHVLVPGLEGCRAPEQEILWRSGPVCIRGPVVRDLMVIEARQEGAGGVRGMQVGISLIEGVAAPVVEKVDAGKETLRHHPRSWLTPEGRLRPGELVDVVPVMEHEIQALFGDPPPSRVVAAIPVLAACGSEAELGHVRARCR